MVVTYNKKQSKPDFISYFKGPWASRRDFRMQDEQ